MCTLLAGAALVAASCLAVTANDKSADSKVAPNPTAVKLTVDERPVTRDGSFGTSFAPIVRKVSPSVVKVFTTISLKSKATNPEDPRLHRFFGEVPDGTLPPSIHNLPRQHGVGSGVIVTADGYILTNDHVVDGADEVKVALQDGREFTAKVIGTDPKTDVAVLKVDATNLPFIEIADSDKIEVGDIVLAIGNPFGIGQTVTSGIVSATDRANMGLDYEDFIQTDAAINPGNSGEALVDAEGRLIGINTAIISRSGGNQGIGFAVPTNLARDVMESLIKYGKVQRGYLGIVIQDVTPALAKEFKLKASHGALVGDVTPKGPADKAGFASGDVVIEFNGKPVLDSRHLKLEVGRTLPGSTVTVQVQRDGATKELKVTLQELPGTENAAKTNGPDDTGTLNGVGVADLDRQTRRELDVPDKVGGALVTGVEEDSAARDAGLQSGDVIEEINRQPVKNADNAVRLTEKSKDKTTLLKVWSKGNSHYIVVDETKAG
jgi:serine protease Do